MQSGLGGRRAAVLGAGRQGRCAAYDLAVHAGAETVTICDHDDGVLDDALATLRRLAPDASFAAATADASSRASMRRVLDGAAAAVSAVPYRFGVEAATAAVDCGCSLVDLGGNTDVSRRILDLGNEAKRAGCVLVPDTGLAPGLLTTLAADGMRRMEEPKSVRMWCGGLPDGEVPPFGYRLVFNIEGLFNEYSGEALALRDGRLARIPALSEIEPVELPGVGKLEAFPTSGGTSTAPESLAGKLDEYDYRTVRYPGHATRFRAFAELGLLQDGSLPLDSGEMVRPRDLLARLLTPLLERPDVPDLVVARVEVRGRDGGAETSVTYDLLDRQDPVTGFTAMERTTAHPAACVAEMAAAGEIEPGARRLETEVDPSRFLARFESRPVKLSIDA